jgi:AcrR family transcriptional regulator
MTEWSELMSIQVLSNVQKKGGSQTIPNRRDRRKLATRQALLDATLALLGSRSIDALSVDEIAMRADVAKGTFYNYFPDKEALERELSAHVRGRLEDEIARANQGIEDPARRIARAFCCVLRFCLSRPEEAGAMMRLFPHSTDPAAPLNSGARRDAVGGIAQGRLVASSEDAAIACIIGVFMGGVNRALDLPPGHVGEFAQGLGAILLHGLGLKRAEAERIMRDSVQSVLARS